MDEINLLICDEDFRYANALGENIMRRNDLVFRVQVCTSIEHAMEFAEKKSIHILVIGDSFAYDEREKLIAQQVFVLTGELEDGLTKDRKKIFKYQSAEDILGDILEQFYEKSNVAILKTGSRQGHDVIGVYSPIHRIGKTTFALGLGMEVSKNKRTLYVNLEDYADVGERFALSNNRNLGDLIYYMRQENGNLLARLSTMVVKKQEMDYIPPILSNFDLRDVTKEEWKKLLDMLIDESGYEVIILDLGDSIDGLEEILQICNEIYMPVLDDAISEQKVIRFEEGLRNRNGKQMEPKIKKFVAMEDMNAYAKVVVKGET